MKISNDNPPNGIREEAEAAFNLKGKHPIFTYGDTIYNPHQGGIDPPLMKHEETHMYQQGSHPGGPDGWWKQYFEDEDFRFIMELEAYRNQWDAIRTHHNDGNVRIRELHRISVDLGSGMYGAPLPLGLCMKLIKREAEPHD